MEKKIKVDPSLGIMVKALLNANRALSDLKILSKKVIISKQLESKPAIIISDNITKASMLINDCLSIANNVKNAKK
jgi:hypothetical protein